jgi:hypothetical protein
MGIRDIKNKCIYLGIKAPTAQALIEILSKLQGYSKRDDLLEKEYYKTVGKTAVRNPYSHFGRLYQKFLEFGLLYEKKSAGGYRLALNKKVWEQDAETIEILTQYAELLQEEMRADSQISTIVSKVRKLYQEDTGVDVPHSVVEPIVAFVVAQKNPDIQNGKFIRFKHTKRRPEQIHESHPPSSTKPQEQAESMDLYSSLAESNKRPMNEDGNLWPSAVLKFLKGNNFQANFHPSQEIIVTISLAQNRTQQVYIRRETDGLLRIETISGPIEEVHTSLVPIFKRNDEISPVKIAVMDRSGIPFVGCVSGTSLISENLPLMKELVIKTARLGDELENTYWDKDLY